MLTPDRLSYLIAAHVFEATPGVRINPAHRAAAAFAYVVGFVRVRVALLTGRDVA